MLVGNEGHVRSEIFLKFYFLLFSFYFSVLRILDPVLFLPLDPRSGMEKIPGLRSGSDFREISSF